METFQLIVGTDGYTVSIYLYVLATHFFLFSSIWEKIHKNVRYANQKLRRYFSANLIIARTISINI